jgi:hypothetical protein
MSPDASITTGCFAAVHESESGTKRPLRGSCRMSVVGGEAENMCSARVFRLLTPNRTSLLQFSVKQFRVW